MEIIEDLASPISPSLIEDQSGSIDDDDFVCVPLSNLNKDKATFNTRDQLLKKSLMMSEVSNVANVNKNDLKNIESRSMVLDSKQKLEAPNQKANGIHQSINIKL